MLGIGAMDGRLEAPCPYIAALAAPQTLSDGVVERLAGWVEAR